MKKALIITGVVILLLVIVLVTVPFLFTDQVAIMVRNKANENLNARVDFKDVSLNMFENFPNLTLNIDNLLITNKAPFDNDTLVSINQFEAAVNVWSLIKGKKIIVEEVKLKRPDIFVLVLKDSTANYNIMKETPAKAKDTAKSGNLNLALKKYSIEDGNIAYIDQTSDINVAVKGLNHKGSGDFAQDDFLLNTETNIDALTLEMGNVRYLNNVKTSLDMKLDANIGAKKFTLKDNELKLNNLSLKFDGYTAMKDSSIIMDLTFGTKRTDFKDLISLIPAVYTEKYKDLKSSGKLALSGYVKGIYNKTGIPSFNIQLNVDNGNFKYPDMPTPVNNVNVDLNVNSPGGKPDNTVVNLRKLHLEIGSEPVDAKLLLKTPKSNPYVEAMFKGHVNLANLKNAVKLQNVKELSGVVDADFQAKGNVPKTKNIKQIENISANGKISASNIVFSGKDLPDKILIRDALLTLNTKQINLNNFYMLTGKSDLQAQGTLSNMFSYLLSDGTITGNLKLNSAYFNINPFLTDNKGQAKNQTDTAKVKAIELPEKINFTMNSTFGTLIYDNLTIQNVKGTITLKDQRLSLNSFAMNMLEGKVIADGYYYTPKDRPPQISFNLNLDKISIRRAYDSFVTVKQFVPMAKNIFGNFGSKLTLNSSLDNNMKPVWNTFNSRGTLNVKDAEIKDLSILNTVADKLKINELKNPRLTNINPTFVIQNGRFTISPFNFSVAGYNVTVAGSNGIDKSLNYTMGVDVPVGKLKTQANQAIGNILGRDIDVIGSNKVQLEVLVTGTINNPSVSTSAGKIAQQTKEQIKQEVKQQVTSEIEKQKENVTKKAEQKADTLKEQLKKEAAKKLKDFFK